MSKMIKMTPECLEQCKNEFIEALSGGKFSDGKVTFTKTLGTLDRKATVFFSELAWMKMQALIREFDKEVAWHGIAYRGDNADTYYIEDILVYPQEVTGTTVTTDQEKYQVWLMDHDDDIFNNIRMQGHSHVNMSTSPSTVDTSLYERLLEQLDDDMFYIFMIWNKKKDKTIKIYDLRENVLFETADVSIEVMNDSIGMEKFISEAKEMVVNKPTTYGSTYYGGYRSNGTYGYYSTSSGKGKTEYSTPSAYSKKGDNEPGKQQALTVKDSKNKGSRKGRRRRNNKPVDGIKFEECDDYYESSDYDGYGKSMTMDEYYKLMYGCGY